MLLGFRSQVVGLDRIGAPFDDCFAAGWKTAQGRVLPIGEVSAEGRLSRRLRSVAVRTFGTCTTAAGDDMIVVELWRAGRGHEETILVIAKISA